MLYLHGISTDATFNLAFEEYMFTKIPRGQECFLLWQNKSAVIVGKHQNTMEEINHEFVREHGIQVVRRMSGGGAVYHDLGNLNFTFIADHEFGGQFDLSKFADRVVSALNELGIPAERTGRNDMTIEGRKFSGNAQYIRSGRILHHGTLLFNSDLDVIQQVLTVNKDKYESKGFKSVTSRVVNIADYLKGTVSLREFEGLLLRSLFGPEGYEEYQLTAEDMAAINQLRDQKYATWEWNFGQSPQYNVRKERRFGAGQISLLLQVERGIIQDIHIYGDFFGDGIPELENMFKGARLKEDVIAERLRGCDVSQYVSGLTNEEFLEALLY